MGVQVTDTVHIGEGSPLLLILGPCQMESRDHTLKIAEFLRDMVQPLGGNLVFKSSFDKANRTSIHGVRGLGLDEGLKILEEVKNEVGVPVVTDVHLPEQAVSAAQVVDIIQIPAFLCRQTDLLVAAGETGKTINIKKGQFLPPSDMKHSAEKVTSTGNNSILLCERGTCFGYRDLIVDMRSFPLMRDLGFPVVFDGTHSVQSLGGSKGKSGGNRRNVFPLCRAAAATGIEGLFLECHDNPQAAPSDGPCMVPLEELEVVLSTVCDLHNRIRDVVAQAAEAG